MVKCPFCNFDNEDGALFCEQCKSDLSAVAPAPAAEETIPVVAVAEEDVPMVAQVDDTVPIAAAEVVAEPVAAPAPAAEPAPAAAEPAPAAAEPAPAPAAAGPSVPPGSQPKLIVIRGQKVNVEFPIYGDNNFIGRSDDKPVDIDLDDQEPPDRVWSSRQHAVINFDEAGGILTIEDLNSANGTFVNRNKLYPGDKKQLFVNDVVQIGTVHLKLKV